MKINNLSLSLSLTLSLHPSLPPSLSDVLGVTMTGGDYYTEPPLSELETTVVGGHCEVENFTVGREGYGKVCFLGVTDVTNLDLDSLGKIIYL